MDKSQSEYNDVINVEPHQAYYYKMTAVDNSGNESGYSNQATVTTLSLSNSNALTEYALNQNTPNPFNPTTNIEYSLRLESQVTITVFDLMGNEVKSLVNEYKQSGDNSVFWDGTNNSGQNVVGGIYFYKLRAGDFIQTRKMVLLK